MDGELCELLTSFGGAMVDKPGWQFVATSYKNVHLRGESFYTVGTISHHDTFFFDMQLCFKLQARVAKAKSICLKTEKKLI